MKKFTLSALVFLSFSLGYQGNVVSAAPVWESSYTKTPPSIDGKMDEVWKKAKPFTVMVRKAMGGGNPKPVVLLALHTDDTLYVLAQWPDTTKSDMRDPYVWNAQKKDYDRPSKPDDQFALEFPLSGEFDINMLTTDHDYTADVWHWKAGRGNPVGWVDDKRHIISQNPVKGAKEYSMGGHAKIYIARVMDKGQSSYKVKPKPAAFEGELVDSFEQRQPTGSLADVRGKGVHDGKTWTLEMARKFNTGHNDDAVIDPSKDNSCAIAVLNDELYWKHSVSPAITLRFINEENRTKSLLWDFDHDEAGNLPKGFKTAVTGKGEPATWQVIADKSAPSKPNVLALTDPKSTGLLKALFSQRFNLAVVEDSDYENFKLNVKFKAVEGKIDQGGGPVWRYQDKNNYYIARANPLEDNFRIYKVVRGSRKKLGSAKLKVTKGQWHEIKIIANGNRFKCYYDDKLYLDVRDDTFKKGKIGLWAKADAVTSFDDLKVQNN